MNILSYENMRNDFVFLFEKRVGMQLVSFCGKESFNLVMGNSSLENIYLCITGVFVIKRIEYEQ